MRPELWRQAEELFHAAWEQSPEDRPAFLDSACGEDTELRRHVDLLVSAEENAGSFLDKAGVADLTATIRAAGSLAGRQFGHYRIVSPLGGSDGSSYGRRGHIGPARTECERTLGGNNDGERPIRSRLVVGNRITFL